MTQSQCGTTEITTYTSKQPKSKSSTKIVETKMKNADNKKKDKLFLLNPGFEDSRLQPAGQKYFCPFNAQLEGVLKYFPELKEELEIIYIDFPRPRLKIVELLGDQNQNMPLLIIERNQVDISTLDVKEYQGSLFISGSDTILKYFVLAFKIPLPHP